MAFDELRRNYGRTTLLEEEMDDHPLRQFERWFDEAQESGLELPDAMVLATVDRAGNANVRTVVLRGIEQDALRFFTNYDSDKSRELDRTPRAALHFHWNILFRQVKLLGSAEPTSREESEEYWAGRPRASQIGAWASPQSRHLRDRAELDASAAEIERRFEGQPIPCPPNWGGYRFNPDQVEFWQGRPSRLHDRLQYLRNGQGAWRLERLAP